MVKMELVFIKNNEIKLEAEYFQSEKKLKKANLLITHPHPQFGGSMYNNIVSGVFNKFIQEDISSLRFNFRGVGNSSGNHTSDRDELSDVKACIDFLLNERKVENIFLCGYSYGAAIGCSTINYSEKIIAYAAISFPWDFMGSKYKKLSQSDKPKFFLQGNRDNISNFERFESHFNDYQDPKYFQIINGADHFYWGYESQVAEKIYEFYVSLI